jgi:hypothetical protein
LIFYCGFLIIDWVKGVVDGQGLDASDFWVFAKGLAGSEMQGDGGWEEDGLTVLLGGPLDIGADFYVEGDGAVGGVAVEGAGDGIREGEYGRKTGDQQKEDTHDAGF